MAKAPTNPEEVYIYVSTCGIYHPLAPRPEELNIEFIAHHLATKGRWNGATQHPMYPERIFLSVAEHSVNVANYVEKIMKRPDLATAALLHDASEAINGDLIRPLKMHPDFAKPFKKVEKMNDEVIFKFFGVAYPMPKEIKVADNAVAAAEQKQVVTLPPSKVGTNEWLDASTVAPFQVEMLSPYQAKMLFLAKWRELRNKEK